MKNKLTYVYILFTIVIGIASSCKHSPKQTSKCKINKYKFEKNAVLGIDVSHHQGKINWEMVKNSEGHKISFVYIKATQGIGWVDPMYHYNIKQARQHGYLVGSYHYFTTKSSPKEQFEHFVKHVNKSDQDLIPMIDLEENNKYNTKTYNIKLKEFLGLINTHFKKKPIIYSQQGFYNTHLKNEYLKYHCWIARYNKHKEPELLDNNKWTLWQFSETKKINGIKNCVDFNYMHPDYNINEICLNN